MEAARRDPRAFEPLYRKYVSQVYSFAVYELRDHHRAEDLTEVVFLRALTALPRFDERGADERSTFRVWLFQIARNAIANERRRLRRRPEAPLEAAELIAATDDPAATATQRDALRAPGGPSIACPRIDVARSCCASSRRCRRARSRPSWAARKALSASSSIVPCVPWPRRWTAAGTPRDAGLARGGRRAPGRRLSRVAAGQPRSAAAAGLRARPRPRHTGSPVGRRPPGSWPTTSCASIHRFASRRVSRRASGRSQADRQPGPARPTLAPRWSPFRAPPQERPMTPPQRWPRWTTRRTSRSRSMAALIGASRPRSNAAS